MRHRVELQRNTALRSPTGQQIDKWSTYATVWMGLEPLSARLRISANQIHADVTHKGTMRFNTSIAAGHRIIKDDRYLNTTRTFEVVSVVDVGERRREMELMLIETQS